MAKEYIEREATCEDCIHYCVCKETVADENWTEAAPKEVREMFSPSGCENYLPTADVVEVVRCKECRQWYRNGGFVDSPNGHCFYHCITTNGHNFCSYGERKGEGDGKI